MSFLEDSSGPPTDDAPPIRPGAGSDARRALGAMLAGGILAALAEIVLGFTLDLTARRSGPNSLPGFYRAFLAAGGWLWIPLWGAAVGGMRAAVWASTTRRCVVTVLVSGLIGLLPLALRPRVFEMPGATVPTTSRAKARAILKWSYRSPETVGQILELSRDPHPQVREQAILALGVNLIVTDNENATPLRPPRYALHPLRGALRDRLLEAMRTDTLEAVRAEAARALWKAPVTFGRHPAAAETLAAVLDRAARPGTLERLAWLALDAAAGAPDSALKSAAARFAMATPDTALASVARMAATAGQ